MNNKIFLLLVLVFGVFGLVSAGSSYQYYYDLDLNFSKEDNQSLSLNFVDVEVSSEFLEEEIGRWFVIVENFEGIPLDVAFFGVENEVYWDSFDDEIGGGSFELEEFSFGLKVPYFENAKQLNFYDNDFNLKLIVDVSMFSRAIPEDFEGVNVDVDFEENVSFDFVEVNDSIEVDVEDDMESDFFEDVVLKNWWMLVVICVLLLIVFIKKFLDRK